MSGEGLVCAMVTPDTTPVHPDNQSPPVTTHDVPKCEDGNPKCRYIRPLSFLSTNLAPPTSTDTQLTTESTKLFSEEDLDTINSLRNTNVVLDVELLLDNSLTEENDGIQGKNYKPSL